MPTCPNCGNKQQGTTKCAKCGSLFAYYTAENAPPQRDPEDVAAENASKAGKGSNSSKEDTGSFWTKMKKAVGVREE